MKWYEIIVTAKPEGTELIADAFFCIGCKGGVKILDKNDILEMKNDSKIWDNIDNDLLNMTEAVRVSGFVEEEYKNEKCAELEKLLNFRKVKYSEINVKEVVGCDWAEEWKRYYHPIEIGKYAIVPNWIKYNKKEKIAIFIEPGMAFGTGEHESTRLCLQLMEKLDFKGKKVIDVGCGSGVLGIAALKSGAEKCCFYDIDSLAIAATKENCIRNDINMSKTRIELADLLTNNSETGDIVLANLTADIHIRLSENLSLYIEKGGCLICSGIINSRKKDVIAAFENKGLKFLYGINNGEWNGLVFTR